MIVSMFISGPVLHLHCFSSTVSSVLDVDSFDRHLRRRRDANFFVFGQLCKFIHKLASRCAHPDSFPVNTDWFGLVTFDLKKLQLLTATSFLKRLKLRKSFEPALVTKTERDYSLKSGSPGFAEALDKVRGAFALQARTFFLSLLHAVRGHISLTSDITQGLSCFDPQVLFSLTVEQASRCFGELHSSFELRKWLPADSLAIYRDEYLSFRDHLRISFPDLKKDASFIPDIVEFLTPLTALRSRKHLLYLYELSCLCLTEPGPDLPPVKFSTIDTSDYKCAFISAIEPVQSYLSRVADGVSVCAPESATSDFLKLLEEKPVSDFDLTYDPWVDFNLFDRKKIFKTLDASHKSLDESISAAAGTASVVSSTAVNQIFVPFPGKARKVAFSGPKIPKKGAKKSASPDKTDQSASTSKNSSRRSSLSDNGESSNSAKL